MTLNAYLQIISLLSACKAGGWHPQAPLPGACLTSWYTYRSLFLLLGHMLSWAGALGDIFLMGTWAGAGAGAASLGTALYCLVTGIMWAIRSLRLRRGHIWSDWDSRSLEIMMCQEISNFFSKFYLKRSGALKSFGWILIWLWKRFKLINSIEKFDSNFN